MNSSYFNCRVFLFINRINYGVLIRHFVKWFGSNIIKREKAQRQQYIQDLEKQNKFKDNNIEKLNLPNKLNKEKKLKILQKVG